MLNFLLAIICITSYSVELQELSEPRLAIAPLLLVALFVGAAGLIGLGVVLIFGNNPKDIYKGKKQVKLAILGPNASGKTTLWNFLKGTPSSKTYQETPGKITMSFLANNILFNANKPENFEKAYFSGYDINGHGDFIRTEWESLINESKMIIFIFNAYKYLTDRNYERDVNQRLQLVKNFLDKKDDKETNIWLLGSYADALNNKKEDWSRIIGMLRARPYSDLSSNNACLNLTDIKELKELYNQWFN